MFPRIMLYSVILVCPLLLLYNTPNVSGYKEPLLLTPYIQQGHITTAKQLSLVVDEEGVIPRSHAGYITVDQISGNHLFFWFFPTFNSNSSAPLLIWLNGGPGESSMVGLLLENGPIQIEKSNSGETIYTIRNNSWVNKFSMLYIDNPVGTGYSYSDNFFEGYRSTQDGFTRDLFEFIQQFYQMFPEFLQRDLYIGGQSYAGKYVPGLAYRLHQQIYNCESEIPLKGIYLSSPLIDFKVQTIESFDLYYNLGYITGTEMDELKRNVIDKVFRLEGDQFFRIIPRLSLPNGNGNLHTSENLSYIEFAVDVIMKSDKVRSLLHVGDREFQTFSPEVEYFVTMNDFKVSTVMELSELMDNYKVLIYGGDMDGIISARGIEAVVFALQWSSRSAYNSSTRIAWFGENGRMKAFYSRVSNFCRVVIRGAGHRTGIHQPDSTLEVIDHFVSNGCLS